MAIIKRIIEKSDLLMKPLVYIQNLYYNLFYPGFHQISGFTMPDRYPQLFRFPGLHINKEELRILSYGCSTGDECDSLSKIYPKATIVGVDINMQSLREAKRRYSKSGILFLESTRENIENHGPYDVVFCMSVLCRWPGTRFLNHTEKIYPFKKFDSQIQLIDSMINSKGFLILTNSNFRFTDTKTSEKYMHYQSPDGVEADIVPKFSKENIRMNTSSFTDFIYQKL